MASVTTVRDKLFAYQYDKIESAALLKADRSSKEAFTRTFANAMTTNLSVARERLHKLAGDTFGDENSILDMAWRNSEKFEHAPTARNVFDTLDQEQRDIKDLIPKLEEAANHPEAIVAGAFKEEPKEEAPEEGKKEETQDNAAPASSSTAAPTTTPSDADTSSEEQPKPAEPAKPAAKKRVKPPLFMLRHW